jgi:glycosyltransferase involved in cell wall biosynthesis
VRLPGFKQYAQLPVYYGLAEAFVHASTSEPWGLVVNEAMAAGLAVLVSKQCGCAADLVRDGVNGFRFDPQNVEELAALMSRLWRSPQRCAAMGQASLRIISYWGLERFGQGFRQAAQMAVQGCLSEGPKGLSSPALRRAP